MRSAGAKRPEPAGFAQARDRAAAALDRMAQAESEAPGGDAAAAGSGGESRAARIAAARREAIQYCTLALQWPADEVPAEDRSWVRYYLAYLHYKAGDLAEAAATAEELARQDPRHPQAQRAAKIALAACTMLFNQAATAPQQRRRRPTDDRGGRVHRPPLARRAGGGIDRRPGRLVRLGRGVARAAPAAAAAGRDGPAPGPGPAVAHRRGPAGAAGSRGRWQGSPLARLAGRGARAGRDRAFRRARRRGRGLAGRRQDRAAGRGPRWPRGNAARVGQETWRIALRAYIAAKQWPQAEAALRGLEPADANGAAAARQATQAIIRSGRDLEEQLQRLRGQKRSVALTDFQSSLERFLWQVANRPHGNTFWSLQWVAEAYLGMGAVWSGRSRPGGARPRRRFPRRRVDSLPGGRGRL